MSQNNSGVAKRPSNFAMVLWRDAEGNVSYAKIGILAAVVAYTFFFNPWFILGMFEIFIFLYLIVAFWKIVTNMMKYDASASMAPA